jgi:hypothetical protein
VICFGTGQTAHAVLTEGAAQLDIVDVNPGVFALADSFPSNGGVIHDPRVETIAMDGRAWLRRNDATYDVITMEPMAPFQAGVNALYSKEFYELARPTSRAPTAWSAQWLPFHLVPAARRALDRRGLPPCSRTRSLWFDPIDHTGIPAPARRGGTRIGRVVAGARPRRRRAISTPAILARLRLDAARTCVCLLRRAPSPVTDDNQAHRRTDACPRDLMTVTGDALAEPSSRIQHIFEAL